MRHFPKPVFKPAREEGLKHLYEKQAANPGYKALVEQLSAENVIGIWDDHDYGVNDGGKEYGLKALSQQLFLDFLNVPKESPRRTQEGIYFYSDRDEGRVRYIMLDNRYHKDEYGTVDGDFLGEGKRGFVNSLVKQRYGTKFLWKLFSPV